MHHQQIEPDFAFKRTKIIYVDVYFWIFSKKLNRNVWSRKLELVEYERLAMEINSLTAFST